MNVTSPSSLPAARKFTPHRADLTGSSGGPQGTVAWRPSLHYSAHGWYPVSLPPASLFCSCLYPPHSLKTNISFPSTHAKSVCQHPALGAPYSSSSIHQGVSPERISFREQVLIPDVWMIAPPFPQCLTFLCKRRGWSQGKQQLCQEDAASSGQRKRWNQNRSRDLRPELLMSTLDIWRRKERFAVLKEQRELELAKWKVFMSKRPN